MLNIGIGVSTLVNTHAETGRLCRLNTEVFRVILVHELHTSSTNLHFTCRLLSYCCVCIKKMYRTFAALGYFIGKFLTNTQRPKQIFGFA